MTDDAFERDIARRGDLSPSFVYVIKDDRMRLVKIGAGADPHEHLAEDQAGRAESAQLAYVAKVNGRFYETLGIADAARGALAGWRLAGDWYLASVEEAAAAIVEAAGQHNISIEHLPQERVAEVVARGG